MSKSKAQKIQVKRIPQALVFNPKVEQVVRAIYFGYDGTDNVSVVSSVKGTAIDYFKPTEAVNIGIADAQGYRFRPESNSALITLGYHPTAVLLWLTQMRLDGHGVVAASADSLVAVHAAVVQLARDMVFNYEKVEMIKGKPRVVGKPVLTNYLQHGKPAKFA